MTKPWEQEWKDVGGPCGGRVANDADEVLADEVTDEALPLILAAPDMARALIGFIESAKDSDLRFIAPGPLSLAHEALKKAGVL